MRETNEAKIRNLITPYFNLIKVIQNLQDPTLSPEDSEILLDFLRETSDTKAMLEGCERLINLGKEIDSKL